MDGTGERAVFSIVEEHESEGFRVYAGRFLDDIEIEVLTGDFEKSSFVVQTLNENHYRMMTYALAVQRASQRLLMFICAIDSELKLFIRDI